MPYSYGNKLALYVYAKFWTHHIFWENSLVPGTRNRSFKPLWCFFSTIPDVMTFTGCLNYLLVEFIVFSTPPFTPDGRVNKDKRLEWNPRWGIEEWCGKYANVTSVPLKDICAGTYTAMAPMEWPQRTTWCSFGSRRPSKPDL